MEREERSNTISNLPIISDFLTAKHPLVVRKKNHVHNLSSFRLFPSYILAIFLYTGRIKRKFKLSKRTVDVKNSFMATCITDFCSVYNNAIISLSAELTIFKTMQFLKQRTMNFPYQS